MSEQPVTADGLPKWDHADRMRKSLRHSGMTVQEIAAELDVDRSTVSTWINNRVLPPASKAKLWALRTGVPFTWICHGSLEPCDIEPVAAGQRRSNSMQRLQTFAAV